MVRIKNKYGDTAVNTIGDSDPTLRNLIRRAEAQASVSKDDIANGMPFMLISGWLC